MEENNKKKERQKNEMGTKKIREKIKKREPQVQRTNSYLK